jgi:hypothetical protein
LAARHIFQANFPVWIVYTQGNITSMIFTWVTQHQHRKISWSLEPITRGYFSSGIFWVKFIFNTERILNTLFRPKCNYWPSVSPCNETRKHHLPILDSITQHIRAALRSEFSAILEEFCSSHKKMNEARILLFLNSYVCC